MAKICFVANRSLTHSLGPALDSIAADCLEDHRRQSRERIAIFTQKVLIDFGSFKHGGKHLVLESPVWSHLSPSSIRSHHRSTNPGQKAELKEKGMAKHLSKAHMASNHHGYAGIAAYNPC